jgi:uncharacterized protein
MEKTECRIMVFAKAPVPGEVKTRLASCLGASRAAALYEALVLYCLNTALASAVGEVELWCAPSADHSFFKACAKRFPVKLYQQAEGDVGMRMAHAFEGALKDVPYALLMGTDCPSVNEMDLRDGCSALRAGADAVLSPAEDGGYVLAGLRRYAPALFEGIAWGTERVMEMTRGRLRELAWQWHELPTRWDVDRPDDVDRLIREGYGLLTPSGLDSSSTAILAPPPGEIRNRGDS